MGASSRASAPPIRSREHPRGEPAPGADPGDILPCSACGRLLSYDACWCRWRCPSCRKVYDHEALATLAGEHAMRAHDGAHLE